MLICFDSARLGRVAAKRASMITGYNTDVRHRDLDFHVQTEDKGTGNPFIESLIYVGGQVLAAKRTGYAEVLAEGKGEKAIIGIMDQQHRAMIAAIRAGKFDDRVRALLGTDQLPADAGDGQGMPEIKSDRTLDEVILEYLTSEAQQEHLMLLLEEEVELTLGRQSTLTVRTSSSKSGLPVAGVQVTVKLISTADEPRILSSGVTDEGGCLGMDLRIPEVVQGTSALIITAASPIGKAELKYLL